jgi:hypothetical protein
MLTLVQSIGLEETQYGRRTCYRLSLIDHVAAVADLIPALAERAESINENPRSFLKQRFR